MSAASIAANATRRMTSSVALCHHIALDDVPMWAPHLHVHSSRSVFCARCVRTPLAIGVLFPLRYDMIHACHYTVLMRPTQRD